MAIVFLAEIKDKYSAPAALPPAPALQIFFFDFCVYLLSETHFSFCSESSNHDISLPVPTFPDSARPTGRVIPLRAFLSLFRGKIPDSFDNANDRFSSLAGPQLAPKLKPNPENSFFHENAVRTSSSRNVFRTTVSRPIVNLFRDRRRPAPKKNAVDLHSVTEYIRKSTAHSIPRRTFSPFPHACVGTHCSSRRETCKPSSPVERRRSKSIKSNGNQLNKIKQRTKPSRYT